MIGWLEPDGRIHECEVYDHAEDAVILCHFRYREDLTADDAEDYLLNAGWVRITFNKFLGRGYEAFFNKHLTENQKTFFKNMYDSNEWLSDSLKSKLAYENII